jgi:hypothetical protein
MLKDWLEIESSPSSPMPFCLLRQTLLASIVGFLNGLLRRMPVRRMPGSLLLAASLSFECKMASITSHKHKLEPENNRRIEAIETLFPLSVNIFLPKNLPILSTFAFVVSVAFH